MQIFFLLKFLHEDNFAIKIAIDFLAEEYVNILF